MPAAAIVSLYVALPGRHEAEIPALIAAQGTPGAPLFRRYLTPAQYGAYFGADPSAFARAIAALRTAGFAIDRVARNLRDVEVHAPAAVVTAFFRTPLDVRTGNGQTFFTARYEPQTPPELGGAAVFGFDSYQRFRPHHRHPNSTIGGNTGWAPPDIQSAYDLSPIYTSSTGSGITIADATVGFARSADFSAFTKQFGGSATLTSVTVGTNAPSDNNGETTLDVEWMAGVAPGASIDQVSPPNASNKSFDSMYSYIANDLSSVHVVSTSWGVCELQMSKKEAKLDESLFAQSYTEGQWWLSASGDNGSDDCYNGKEAVDFPGSSPYVIGVGGTEVTPKSTKGSHYSGWKNEVTWGTKGDGASGGGTSVLFAKPSYQSALTPNDGARDVPDVALMADDSDPNGGYIIYYRGQWESGWGGTSFAAPMWAGFLALLAQEKGGTISSPLDRLYALAGTSSYVKIFHDITAGCNSFDNVPGYCAAAGYDQTTGLGSFDGANLYNAY